MNESAEKHQQVPDLYWFLIDVIGSSFTVVNSYFGPPRKLICAYADDVAMTAAAAIMIDFNFIFFMFCY